MPDLIFNSKSEDIKVFPYGNTRAGYPDGRIVNEGNLTSLIRSLTDYSSYVVSYDEDTYFMRFVLGGYYIEYDPKTEPVSPLYAYINIDKDSTFLIGGDDADSNTFTGINFSNTDPEELDLEAAPSYVIQLLDAEGKVPSASKRKFSIDSYNMENYYTKAEIESNYQQKISIINCGSADIPNS